MVRVQRGLAVRVLAGTMKLVSASCYEGLGSALLSGLLEPVSFMEGKLPSNLLVPSAFVSVVHGVVQKLMLTMQVWGLFYLRNKRGNGSLLHLLVVVCDLVSVTSNYSSMKLELLAFKWAVTEKFREYVLANHNADALSELPAATDSSLSEGVAGISLPFQLPNPGSTPEGDTQCAGSFAVDATPVRSTADLKVLQAADCCIFSVLEERLDANRCRDEESAGSKGIGKAVE
ncbi:hypothetical protein SRHO_G00033560 [Serrasalmus rhombeus]